MAISAIRLTGVFQALWQFRHLGGDGVSHSGLSSVAPPRGREFSSREAVLPLTYLVKEDGLHTLARLALGDSSATPTSEPLNAIGSASSIRNPLTLCLLEIEMAAC